MNWVLWLQQRNGVKVSGKPKKDDETAPPNIFIALPHRPPLKPTSLMPTPLLPPSVFVLLPPQGAKRSTNQPQYGAKRWKPSTALVSVFSLAASVFAAIGMLQLMITGMNWHSDVATQWRPGLAAHKPGPGPSPLDAVSNEYQHALTREMVAAADAMTKTASKKTGKREKAILPQIRVTTDRFSNKIKGQINDLKLKIFNGSEQLLDKVTIQVDYLTRAGHLIHTESYTTDSIAPLQLKTIEVPQGMPGTQIRYHIQEIRSKSLRTTLRGL